MPGKVVYGCNHRMELMTEPITGEVTDQRAVDWHHLSKWSGCKLISKYLCF